LLEEVVAASRENLDAGHVARYDEKKDARAADEVELLMALGLDRRSTVVDLGAGTGQFALAVAPACGRVVAVDISPVMLARLRAKVAESRLSNVGVVQAGFLSYEHSGALTDFVYSRWALHHLPDFWKSMALKRMRMILRPGGLLRLSDIAYSFDAADAETRIEAWCATLPVQPTTQRDWSRTDIEEHVRDEHSTFTCLLEAMIQRSGFEIEDAVYSEDGIFAEYILRAG